MCRTAQAVYYIKFSSYFFIVYDALAKILQPAAIMRFLCFPVKVGYRDFPAVIELLRKRRKTQI